MSLFECVLNHCLRKLKLNNSLLSRKLKLYYLWIKSPSLVTPTPFETTLHFRNLFLSHFITTPSESSSRHKCSHYQNFVFPPYMLHVFPISSPLQLIILKTFISNYEGAFYKSVVFANPTSLPIPLIQVSPGLRSHTSCTYIRGAQTSAARSSWRLNFVRWHLIFMGLSMELDSCWGYDLSTTKRKRFPHIGHKKRGHQWKERTHD